MDIAFGRVIDYGLALNGFCPVGKPKGAHRFGLHETSLADVGNHKGFRVATDGVFETVGQFWVSEGYVAFFSRANLNKAVDNTAQGG